MDFDAKKDEILKTLDYWHMLDFASQESEPEADSCVQFFPNRQSKKATVVLVMVTAGITTTINVMAVAPLSLPPSVSVSSWISPIVLKQFIELSMMI